MLTPEQQRQIQEAHLALPEVCRFSPASPEELDAFEAEFGPIPQDFRWYLEACGGGVIGSEWIDGVDELCLTHRKFRQARLKGFYGDTEFFPVGWDGSGDPFGFSAKDGHLAVILGDCGLMVKEADDFYGLLQKKGLLGPQL